MQQNHPKKKTVERKRQAAISGPYSLIGIVSGIVIAFPNADSIPLASIVKKLSLFSIIYLKLRENAPSSRLLLPQF